MKTAFLISLVITTVLLSSCAKEDDVVYQNKNSQSSSKNQKQTFNEPVEVPMVVYANLACDLDGGVSGCQCTITSSDDDCSLQTDCTPNSNFPHYKDALEAMFDQNQIWERAVNSVRITEPELKAALILDGYPLKP